MEGVTVILLREYDASHAGLGSAHLRGQNLSGVFLAHPEHELIANRVTRFDKTIGKGGRVSVEVPQIPVELLLIETHSVKHVVTCNCDFVLTGRSVSRKLRINPGSD